MYVQVEYIFQGIFLLNFLQYLYLWIYMCGEMICFKVDNFDREIIDICIWIVLGNCFICQYINDC